MAKSVPPPGTSDIFPEDAPKWRFLERTAERVFGTYNFGEMRTPIYEYTEVFHRGLGSETDIVSKEMYTFEDRGGRSLTLRPEGTAGIMRALLNTDVLNGVEQRVYYCGPMFRGERPAAGRKRQFHQLGAECVGRTAPELDVEIISMMRSYLNAVGIADAVIVINTRGVAADREAAAELLKPFFAEKISCMCADCQVRLEKNFWRLLDCKQPGCRAIIADAPDYLEVFSAESRAYFARVTELLSALGIPYRHNRNLVRGLDYYVHTVFEIEHPCMDGAIGAGGRYELYLPGQNRPLNGVGFGFGMERLLMTQESLGFEPANAQRKLVYLASPGTEAIPHNLLMAAELRAAGVAVECEIEAKSLKAQMRAANRLNAAVTLIVGGDEMAENMVELRNMENGEQTRVPRNEIVKKCLDILTIKDGE